MGKHSYASTPTNRRRRTRHKHGADTRTQTPLSILFSALAENHIAIPGKRTAVVAALGALAAAAALPTSLASTDGGREQAVSVEQQPTSPEYRSQKAVTVKAGKASHKAGELRAPTVKAKSAHDPAPTNTPTADTSPRVTATKAPASTSTTTRTSRHVSVPSSGTRGEKVVAIAKSYVGTPYVWGGTTPSGWDCSGFVSYVYRKVGVSLPRTSGAIRSAGTAIPKSQAEPGDILWHPGHVGIYAGDGKMIDARNSRVGTVYTSDAWMSDATVIRIGK